MHDGSLQPPAGPLGPTALGVPGARRPEQEPGGESPAQEKLESWCAERGRLYNAEKSKPGLAWTSNSRLGPYLAWGQISLREVHQALERKHAKLIFKSAIKLAERTQNRAKKLVKNQPKQPRGSRQLPPGQLPAPAAGS